MAKNLVIVESPAKAKTIKRYLGNDYQVTPSVGHVVDLPKSTLGVDIEHDFKPEYHVIPGKLKIIEDIKKQAKGKDHIYLATDPDREGEAIAFHIADRLGKTLSSKVQRILLHEITKDGVKDALANPTALNRPLFDAQQARRVLDRLVGYRISPILWDKVKRGISAGRVQSVALRIIVEREKEREAFRAEEYWTLDAQLEGKNPPNFKARLFSHAGQRIDNKAYKLPEQEAKDVIAACEKKPFTVKSIESKEVRRSATPPFITSRLQQEAARALGTRPRARCESRSAFTKVSSLARQAPPALSLICVPIRRAYRRRRSIWSAATSSPSTARNICPTTRTFIRDRSPRRMRTKPSVRPRSNAIPSPWRSTSRRTNSRSTLSSTIDSYRARWCRRYSTAPLSISKMATRFSAPPAR